MANEWIKKVEQAAEFCVIQEFPAYKDENYPLRNEKIEKFSRLFKAGCDYALTHQWIDVNDELPEEDDIYFVLINYRGHFLPSVTDFETKTKSWTGYNNISHWMPIPKMNEE